MSYDSIGLQSSRPRLYSCPFWDQVVSSTVVQLARMVLAIRMKHAPLNDPRKPSIERDIKDTCKQTLEWIIDRVIGIRKCLVDELGITPVGPAHKHIHQTVHVRNVQS